MFKIHHYETLHIPLWLLKDTFWMLHWRIAGSIMIIPAILVALIITIKSYREEKNQWFVNLAVCFWIAANSWWMYCEFNKQEEQIHFALYPFLLGILSVVVFYIRRLKLQGEN